MTKLGFLLARTLRLEAPLRGLSVPKAELMAELKGRRVALVGNARSLVERDEGGEIDRADLVIRINRAPMPATRTHGARTDWLALATTIPERELERIRPRRILWMSHKRKRLTWRDAASHGFYLHERSDWQRLGTALGAPPTTGLMMVEFLAESELKELHLHGFDFFASKSLTGSRSADQVPHDFETEARFVRALAARDPRVTLHGV
ncbi:MAG: glycosyltransferase family 29 protein [Rhodobacteraceae bacterium]|nr:glycosyltransferase family 29 protein [Paracoccaceae bacterium]